MTVQLGGLEGALAKKKQPQNTTPIDTRPVFSYLEVADKFIDDYYFQVTVDGVSFTLKFYLIITI